MQKLKDDAADKKADVTVLVSTVLPPTVSMMELRDGVWIVEPACVGAVATALRETLLQLDHVRAIDANRTHVRDSLYEYLSSREFQNWLATLVEVFIEMRGDLDAEKRAFTRMWSKREWQIERMALSSAGMYGELQGIMGTALASVDLLELPPAA